ncbi:MAG TPA: SMP-30/gluconolactonase/LRE family protein [Dongiaceae bacterium]|nr:SMP-30/gluconolactonase/LRE family protein [Dongiaceae bacterium]
MASQMGRYAYSGATRLAEGWSLERLTPPSRLFGANGIRTGPDGRIYVAQVSGSQISAIDVNSGAIETISPKGGSIVAPDDLVFDAQGNIFTTEITEGRVSVLSPNGQARVLQGDLPCANPITIHQGRLFTGECRFDGRILELDLNGGAPRVILENVPLPNAMEVGPDGMLYFPVMGANEIWRVNLNGGAPEVVARDLGVPDAVKFDAQGFIVSTQVASGQVLRIDPRTGERTVLATIAPGLDNLTFVGDRLFVSSISGQINEILPGGKLQSLVPDGLNWPLGLAVGSDGVLFVADGGFTYTLRAGGALQPIGMLFSPGFPGYTRGVAAAGPGEYVVTTANGQVSRWVPGKQEHQVLAEGFDQLYGIALAPGGTAIFAEKGRGRLLSVRSDSGHSSLGHSNAVETLAEGLNQPSGVAFSDDGCLVAEEGAGRVVRTVRGGVETVLGGLHKPQGILVRGDLLFVVDVGTKELIQYNMTSKTRLTIASQLPVGAPPGVIPKNLGAIGVLSGPMGPFAGIAEGPNGALYVSADAEGSVLELRPVSPAH